MTEGKVELYSHNGGRIGVMVEVNTETEFVSSSDLFQNFVHEIALQIAAASPIYVSDADIPQLVLSDLALKVSENARSVGKPEKVIERIIEGVLEKYKDDNVLLRQVYIRDENRRIHHLLDQAIVQTGETIIIRRFLRWEIIHETENELIG